jgi:hypothetical protein
MDTYEGDGGFSLGGCAILRKTAFYNTLFDAGSLVYVCKSASKKGILEAVFIKKVKLVDDQGVIIPLYIDTFNWLHNENDLCTQDEAVNLAIIYQESVIATVQNQLKTCSSGKFPGIYLPRSHFPRDKHPRCLPGCHRFHCGKLDVRPDSGV